MKSAKQRSKSTGKVTEHGKPGVPVGEKAALAKSEVEKHHKAVVEAGRLAAEGKESMISAVRAAVQAGIIRKQVVGWILESGFTTSESSAESTVSVCLREAGQTGKGRTGGGAKGRKTPAAAKELAAYAVKTYGDEAQSLLLSAYRVVRDASK